MDFIALSAVSSSLIDSVISSLTKTNPTSGLSVSFLISSNAFLGVSEIIPGTPAYWKLVTKDLLPTVNIFTDQNFVYSNLTLFGRY